MIGYARLVSVFTARVRLLDAVSSKENQTQTNEEEEGEKKTNTRSTIKYPNTNHPVQFEIRWVFVSQTPEHAHTRANPWHFVCFVLVIFCILQFY